MTTNAGTARIEALRRRDLEAATSRLLLLIARSDPSSPSAGRLREGLAEIEGDNRLTPARKLKNVKRLIRSAAPENVRERDLALLAEGGE